MFPQPLINRFLMDDVILAKRLDLLPLVVNVFIGFNFLSLGLNVIQVS
ncbi:hypothetical protein ACFLXB_05015 [Chloroflexota bacterium]